MSRNSDQPRIDPVAGKLARVLTASQVLAVFAVVVGLVLAPGGRDVSVRSVSHVASLLGIGALLVGPFLGLGVLAAGSAPGSARWFAWGAVLVAGAGTLLALLS